MIPSLYHPLDCSDRLTRAAIDKVSDAHVLTYCNFFYTT